MHLQVNWLAVYLLGIAGIFIINPLQEGWEVLGKDANLETPVEASMLAALRAAISWPLTLLHLLLLITGALAHGIWIKWRPEG